MSCFKAELQYYTFSELSSAVFFCRLKYCGCSIMKKKNSTVSNFLKEKIKVCFFACCVEIFMCCSLAVIYYI